MKSQALQEQVKKILVMKIPNEFRKPDGVLASVQSDRARKRRR
jgi:hypothetical protein